MTPHATELATVEVAFEKDLFLRKLLRELTGTLEDVVGVEAASGYIATVGSIMGQWLDAQYRQALSVDHLDLRQVAEVCIDLKRRIGGRFRIVSIDEEKLVIANGACPFGRMVLDRTSLCMMTSNVFGRIAADNLGYARVELRETIARGSDECLIVIHLAPRDHSSPDEREYYRTLSPGDE